MPRIDAWETKRPARPALDLGFQRGLEDAYEWGAELGRGGFGTVRLVRRRAGGQEYACKSISKVLPNASPPQQGRHLEMIKREVVVLRKLMWTLNVVRLEGVYEDNAAVHILMECCRGGELFRQAGSAVFSEEAVAKIMLAVLRTLAHCHANHVLHRDIKPGNFMFLTNDQDSPIKAVDFGLAVFYDPEELPRSDLGCDGTPWFMAPEVLSSQVVPASDLWSAGVMAYQLLAGRLPFDDRRRKRAPVLSAVWKAILTEDPSFHSKYWAGISDEAVDFVRSLLHKDPVRRPTAQQALKHPWIRRAEMKPTQLAQTVVQRIQRYGQSSILKRTVLDMIAEELLQKKNCFGRRDFTRVDSSGIPGLQAERMAPGDALDTSAATGGDYLELMDIELPDHSLFAEDDMPWSEDSPRCEDSSWSEDSPVRPGVTSCLGEETEAGDGSEEEEAEGGSFARYDMPSVSSVGMPFSDQRFAPLVAIPQAISRSMEAGQDGQYNYKQLVGPQDGVWQCDAPSQAYIGRTAGDLANAGRELSRAESVVANLGILGVIKGGCCKLILSESLDREDVSYVLQCLQLSSHRSASAEELTEGFRQLGYALEPSEVSSLMKSMAPGNDGSVNLSQFLASQVDWEGLQRHCWEEWLDRAKQAFDDLDKDTDGHIKSQDVLAALYRKLPCAEVQAALEHDTMEICADELEMDFEGFVSLLRVDWSDSLASLDDFDARLVSFHEPSSLYSSMLASVPKY